MITGENIHKTYGPIEVLKGVNITVQKGEIVSSQTAFWGM